METPWGRWSVLETGDNFQVKLLEVDPGQRLSYQRHQHREEHWVVLSGTATVTNRGRTSTVSRTGTTFMEKMVPHRVENRGDVPLLILESQFGDYLGEDDIERLEDDYGRV